MSTQARQHSTLQDVLYHGHRQLRDLGNHQPGFSLEKDAMRELDLLTADGVDTEQCIQLAIYADGHVAADLQTDS